MSRSGLRAVALSTAVLLPGAPGPSAQDSLGPGWDLLRAGRPESAARVFSESVSADPTSSEATRALVTALVRDGRPTEAIAAAQALVDRAPAEPGAWAHLGRAFLSAGRFDEAEQAFLGSVALGESPLGEWGLGRIAASRGDPAAAAARFTTARSLAPDDDEILEAWLRSIDDPQLEARGWALWLGIDRRSKPANRAFIEAILPVFPQYAAVRGNRPVLAEGHSVPATISLERLGRPAGSRLDERRFVWVTEPPEGRARRLLVDTGARGLTLSPAAARAVGFRELCAVRLHGIGERSVGSRAHIGVVEELSLGPFVYRNGLAVRTSAANFPDGVDGVLGIDLFAEWMLELDADHATLRVLPRDAAPRDYRAAVTRRVDSQLLVEAVVAGRIRGWFLLDSGASHTVLDLEASEGLGGRTRSADWWVKGVAGTLKDLRTVPEATVEVAGLRRRDPGLLAYSLDGVSRNLGVRVVGVLGLSFLEGLVVRIDPSGAAVSFGKAAVEDGEPLR